MLVLTRSRKQAIRVGHDVSIMIIDVKGNQVRLGVNAPRHIPIDREEIHVLKQKEASATKKRQNRPLDSLPP